jgi:serine/threonine protein kinase
LGQVGSALAYAAAQGIVHRDIKPANIILDDDGWAIVTDFGIAKVAETQGLTQTGGTVGTPTYMSPEQCKGTEVTGASDQYSCPGSPRADTLIESPMTTSARKNSGVAR